VTQQTALTMPLVRTWYGVMRELNSLASQDTSLNLSLSFPLQEDMESRASQLARHPRISAVLQRHETTPSEFIAASVLMSSGLLALRGDSAQRSLVQQTWGDEFVGFFQRNQREIDSLHSTLDR
jgi:hypothetical protein